MFTISKSIVELMWEFSIHNAFFTVGGVKALGKTMEKLKESQTDEELVKGLIETLGLVERKLDVVYEKYINEEISGNIDLSGRLKIDFVRLSKEKESITRKVRDAKELVDKNLERIKLAYANYEIVMDKFLDDSPNRRENILTYLEQGYVYKRMYIIKWNHGITSIFQIPKNMGPRRTSFINLTTLVHGHFAGDRTIELDKPWKETLNYGKNTFRNSTLKTLMVTLGLSTLVE